MLEIKELSRVFSGFSLGPIDLRIEKGAHFVLIGPSGSGKSLLLEMIAGFQQPTQGSIIWEGTDLLKLPAHKRGVGMVFQRPVLFQHLNVAENIAYPLKALKKNRHSIAKAVSELAEQFQITDLLLRKPGSLSGGEAQRVSLARCIAMEPKILILDEPVSPLDVMLRSQVRKHLIELNKNGLTIFHVTHDFEEAVRMADTIGIIQDGKILQTGRKEEVLRHPTSSFVAELTGLKNYLKASLYHVAGRSLKEAHVQNIVLKLYSKSEASSGIVIIDEDQITLLPKLTTSSAQNNFEGKIISITKLHLGNEVEIDIGIRIFARISDESVKNLNTKEGMPIAVSFKASAVKFLEI